jgi:hypothetical protein
MKQGQKFPLLIYRRYHQVHRSLSLTVLMLGVVLAAAAALFRFALPHAVGGHAGLLFWVGLVLALFGLARYVLTLALSRMAYVQCTPRNVRIQTPFLPVVFSYKRVAGTRPNSLSELFPPAKRRGSSKKMLETLAGETAIVVDLRGYPMSKKFLRTMLGPFLLTPKGTGFVFLVQDWMTLSRQLSTYQEQWQQRVSAARAQRY